MLIISISFDGEKISYTCGKDPEHYLWIFEGSAKKIRLCTLLKWALKGKINEPATVYLTGVPEKYREDLKIQLTKEFENIRTYVE